MDHVPSSRRARAEPQYQWPHTARPARRPAGLSEHLVQVGGDAEQQDQEDHLDNDVGGASGLLERLLELQIHVVQVARGLVHIVADLFYHYRLQLDLVGLVDRDALEPREPLANLFELLVELLIVALNLL